MAAQAAIGISELCLILLEALGIYTAAKTGQATGEALGNALKARQAANTEAATCDPANPVSPCYCPPRAGAMMQRNHHMSPGARAYQARVTGFPPYHEWVYSGVDFDGFWLASCTLIEAKAEYAQFLDKDTDFTTWQTWFSGDFLPQAMRQSGVAIPTPPVLLQWFFMELPVYTLASRLFSRSGLPIICIYQP